MEEAENREHEHDTVGSILNEARRHKGVSVTQVEAATKIRARYVIAMEEDNFGAISGDIYAKGFLKTYATYLGLDPEPLIEQYGKQYDHPLKFDSKLKIRPQEKNSGWFKRFSTTLAMVACLFALLYWGASTSRRTIDREMRSQKPIAQKKTTTAPKKTAKKKAPASTTTTTTKPTTVNVSATATGDEGCWMSVVVDGQQTFQGLIAKGETKEFKAQKSLTLYIGNAGGVSIKRDGKDIGPLGQRGAVVQKDFTLEGK